MTRYTLILTIGLTALIVIAGCTQKLDPQDRALLTESTQAAQQAAQEAKTARDEANKAAAAAQAASERSDRIYQTGQNK